MPTQILGIITLILTVAVGIWKYFSRTGRYKRKVADESKQKVDSGVDNGNTSDITAGFDRLR